MKRVGKSLKTAQAVKEPEFFALFRAYRDEAGEITASNIFIAPRHVAEPLLSVKATERKGAWKLTRIATKAEFEEFLKEQPHVRNNYEKSKILVAESLN